MSDIDRALDEYRQAIDEKERLRSELTEAEIQARHAQERLAAVKKAYSAARWRCGATLRAIAMIAQGVVGIYTDWNEQRKKLAALPVAASTPCDRRCGMFEHDKKCVRYKARKVA